MSYPGSLLNRLTVASGFAGLSLTISRVFGGAYQAAPEAAALPLVVWLAFETYCQSRATSTPEVSES